MKGVLFKYSADPFDPLMKDKESSCSEEGCALRDPDFWINPVTVWGICGPYVRTSLEPDDIVFFLPKQISWKKACLDDYICTGVLVVDRKLADRNAVMSENQLTATYKRSWEKDLDIHLIRDRREAPRTVNIRGRNFIIGDNEKSKWFGKNEKYLKKILMDIGLTIYANSLNNRRIKNIHGNNAKLLYNALLRGLTWLVPGFGSSAFPFSFLPFHIFTNML